MGERHRENKGGGVTKAWCEEKAPQIVHDAGEWCRCLSLGGYTKCLACPTIFTLYMRLGFSISVTPTPPRDHETLILTGHAPINSMNSAHTCTPMSWIPGPLPCTETLLLLLVAFQPPKPTTNTVTMTCILLANQSTTGTWMTTDVRVET